MNVSEYIEAFDVCDSTVRNRIRKNQVEAEMIDGKWYIVVDSQALPKSYVMASGNPTTVTTQSDVSLIINLIANLTTVYC